MLKIPQLDDLTYEQIVNRAIVRIPTMTEEWTDFNSHDPGITVLQTYAWLIDMLNFYMDATGDIHIRKYLKLLGIEPEPARASESFVILENVTEPVRLPKGTGFFAGTIPFELPEDSVYEYNGFCSFIQEIDGTGIDLTAFAGADGETIEVFAEDFERETSAYLGFEKALKDADQLYISVEEEKMRNPFGSDFCLCPLVWEYHTRDGWKLLQAEDETCGFLKSGFIRLHGLEEMDVWQHPEGMEAAYYIRCTLEKNSYDKIPKIGKVYVNPMKVVQKTTVCRQGELLPELQIGKTNGCAGQELLFDYPDVYHFELALWENDEEKDHYELWTMTENPEEADYKDRVFFYDREKRTVCFGDGIHGMVPRQHLKVNVMNLEVSVFEQGNVLPGEIRITNFPLPEGGRVYNPAASLGGRRQEEVPDMLKRLESSLFVQNRMASAEDYEQIIQSTPGLMIDMVHVIPGRIYGELYRKERGLNEVVAVVKPYGKEAAPGLSEVYRNRILQHIESCRLINTKVSIVSPVYTGIEVHAKIMLYADTSDARNRVQQRIREFIDYRSQRRPFGKVISYGRLFTSLESMEEVKMIRELALEKSGPAAVKNDRGDILCQEDALSYVERMNIEFC